MSAFCDLVGCRYPIQQAGMARVTTPALAAAVSDAGGLGMLAFGRQPLALLQAQVDVALALTPQPVGATFIVKFLDLELVDHVAARLPVIEYFWGWPDLSLVREGIVTGWQVGSLDEAPAAADAGCRYVVAQGVEAGGHVRGTMARDQLVAQVRDALDVVVVAAGGIATATDVRRALDHGVDAVRVGTRFLAAAEGDEAGRTEPQGQPTVRPGAPSCLSRGEQAFVVRLSRLLGAQILQEERHSAERCVGPQRLGGVGEGPFVLTVDDGVQRGINGFDPLDGFRHELAWMDLAPASSASAVASWSSRTPATLSSARGRR